MLRKLNLLAVLAAALVAFAVPAAAQAEPLVTNSLGEAAETISAEGTEFKTSTANGTIECATAVLVFYTTTNTGNTYTGHGFGTAVGNPRIPPPHQTCITSSGVTAKITSLTIHDIHLTRGGTNSMYLTYTYQLYSHAFSTSTPVAACNFEGTVGGTTGESSLSISGGLTGGGTALCPTTGEISGEFTVVDENNEPAVIH